MQKKLCVYNKTATISLWPWTSSNDGQRLELMIQHKYELHTGSHQSARSSIIAMWLTAVCPHHPPPSPQLLGRVNLNVFAPYSHITGLFPHCSVKCSWGGHLWVCSIEVGEVYLNSWSGGGSLGRAQIQTRVAQRLESCGVGDCQFIYLDQMEMWMWEMTPS